MCTVTRNVNVCGNPTTSRINSGFILITHNCIEASFFCGHFARNRLISGEAFSYRSSGVRIMRGILKGILIFNRYAARHVYADSPRVNT